MSKPPRQRQYFRDGYGEGRDLVVLCPTHGEIAEHADTCVVYCVACGETQAILDFPIGENTITGEIWTERRGWHQRGH